MPVTVRIDADEGIVYTTIEGKPSTDEVIAALETIFLSPDYRPGLDGIVDLRRSEFDTSPDDLLRIIDFLVEHRATIGRSRSAVVVSKPVTFGLTRMFQAQGAQSPVEVEIFHDFEQARRWIGSPSDPRTDATGGQG